MNEALLSHFMNGKFYSVRLTKILSNHQFLRTDVVEGITENLPMFNESFCMLAESLTEGKQVRSVNTSPVQSIEEIDGKILFKTNNSVYELERI